MAEAIPQPKKKFYKRWWFWVLVVLFVIGVSNNLSQPKKVGTDNAQTDSQGSVFKIGDQISSSGAVLTVTKVVKDWKPNNVFDKPGNPDDVYVVVSVNIENKSNKDVPMSWVWDFKLEDANGLKRDQSLFGGLGLSKLPTGAISPNGKASGDVVFAINKDALSNLKLHYKPIFTWNREIVVELQ